MVVCCCPEQSEVECDPVAGEVMRDRFYFEANSVGCWPDLQVTGSRCGDITETSALITSTGQCARCDADDLCLCRSRRRRPLTGLFNHAMTVAPAFATSLGERYVRVNSCRQSSVFFAGATLTQRRTINRRRPCRSWLWARSGQAGAGFWGSRSPQTAKFRHGLGGYQPPESIILRQPML